MRKIAYTNVTTKKTKKELRKLQTKEWIMDIGSVKTLIMRLPKSFRPVFEREALNKKIFDNKANFFCDVMSSHNKKRYRLMNILATNSDACIYIDSINCLGDDVDEIKAIYEIARKKNIGFAILDQDYSKKAGYLSSCEYSGKPVDDDSFEDILEMIMVYELDENGRRGFAKTLLNEDFWNAYFRCEVLMEIPKEEAEKISDLSKNCFYDKCLEMEKNFDKKSLVISGKAYSYKEALKKELEKRNITSSDILNKPKRFGVLPISKKNKSFADLVKYMEDKLEADMTEKEIQKILNKACDRLGFDRMLYFNFKRYCLKMENPSKKTLSKFFEY